MLRHRFGQKSERYIDLENPQLSLYGEVILDAALDEEDEVSDDSCNKALLSDKFFATLKNCRRARRYN
jgi:transposase